MARCRAIDHNLAHGRAQASLGPVTFDSVADFLAGCEADTTTLGVGTGIGRVITGADLKNQAGGHPFTAAPGDLQEILAVLYPPKSSRHQITLINKGNPSPAARLSGQALAALGATVRNDLAAAYGGNA